MSACGGLVHLLPHVSLPHNSSNAAAIARRPALEPARRAPEKASTEGGAVPLRVAPGGAAMDSSIGGGAGMT